MISRKDFIKKTGVGIGIGFLASGTTLIYSENNLYVKSSEIGYFRGVIDAL